MQRGEEGRAYTPPAIKEILLPGVKVRVWIVSKGQHEMMRKGFQVRNSGIFLPLATKPTMPPDIVLKPARAVAWNKLAAAEDMTGARGTKIVGGSRLKPAAQQLC
jgi:hypothetical protein